VHTQTRHDPARPPTPDRDQRLLLHQRVNTTRKKKIFRTRTPYHLLSPLRFIELEISEADQLCELRVDNLLEPRDRDQRPLLHQPHELHQQVVVVVLQLQLRGGAEAEGQFTNSRVIKHCKGLYYRWRGRQPDELPAGGCRGTPVATVGRGAEGQFTLGSVNRSTGHTHTHTTAEQTTHTNTERATAPGRVIAYRKGL